MPDLLTIWQLSVTGAVFFILSVLHAYLTVSAYRGIFADFSEVPVKALKIGFYFFGMVYGALASVLFGLIGILFLIVLSIRISVIC